MQPPKHLKKKELRQVISILGMVLMIDMMHAWLLSKSQLVAGKVLAPPTFAFALPHSRLGHDTAVLHVSEVCSKTHGRWSHSQNTFHPPS